MASNELSQYKTYQGQDEFFGHFASVPRLYDVMCTIPLVSPQIQGIWTVYKNDGTTVVRSQTTNDLTVEIGYKVSVNINRWWNHNDDYADPDSATFTSGTDKNVLPTSGQKLLYSESNIAASKTFTFKLYRIKTAPTVANVAGSQVLIKPNGIDKLETQISCKVTFKYQSFIGKTVKKSPAYGSDLTQASSSVVKPGLVVNPNLTVTQVNTGSGEYFCYMYPKAMGALKKIIQDGATPVLDAFTLTEINIVNDSGASIPYYVYTSVNDGAFANAKLEFSINN